MADDIGRWLEDLGLSKYADAFAENEIDSTVLPDLSEADFEKIGIPMGPRKKMLRAIKKLNVAAQGTESTVEARVGRAVSAEAERRQLTVMFCDLAGSTALSERLDPEDLREVLRAYQENCSEIIGRYDGHIAKYIGDGLLVYFGYPQAHEDDAQRAVRAGLEIVAGVAGLRERIGQPLNIDLAVHLGIHTGLVVAGEMGAGDTREEMAIVGETPNVAARLEGLAEPGSVLISASTHTLIEGLFVCEDLGPQSLKGLSEPVGVYRVQGETDARSRFEAAASRGLTPLVGREQEIALLLDRWEQAKEGEGQVVLLSSEAGIGKSRIAQMLRDRVAAEDHVRLRYQCSPYHTNSALYPFIDQLGRAAGFARDDPFDIRLDKLESLLAQSSTGPAEAVPLLAALLSIPTGDRFGPLEMNPELQKERTLAALIGQMNGLAAHRPILIIFEDAHWIDPTSQELLDLMVDQAQAIRALVVITYRPVFTAPWGGHPHVTSLTLNRLGRRQSETMVGVLTGNKPFPEEVLSQILAKTDGVPLFVEELTKTVLEAGFLKEEEDRYVLTSPLPPLAIPATLHDSLMARLDRLSPIKEIAQTAAAIGREFSHELLAGVSSASDEELVDALAQLADAELIFRRGTPSQASYIFKHALVQEAAYESLLKSKRREIHGLIAQVLEEKFPERANAEPDLLAHHYTEAGLAEPAIGYWQKAGTRSVERSANVEAVAHLRKALELISSEPESPTCLERELDVQILLGGALTGTAGYAAPETGDAYLRARDLCQQIGDTPQIFPALYGVWNLYYVSCRLQKARGFAEEFLDQAQRQKDRARLVAAHGMVGQILTTLAEFDSARQHSEKLIEYWDPKKDRSLGVLYGEHPAISILGYQSWIYWFLGYPDQALERSRRALEAAYGLSHATSTGLALMFTSWHHKFRREPEVVLERAEKLIALSAEQSLPFWLALATALKGWAKAEQGEADEGIARMQEGLAAARATGAQIFVPGLLALLAEGYLKAGQYDKGLSLIAEAFSTVERTGERWHETELHWLKGTLLLAGASQNEVEAEARFRQAIAVAQDQGAKSMELRAATSLARLWSKQGKDEEAYNLLTPVRGWFTEGFETPDLKEANALLVEVG